MAGAEDDDGTITISNEMPESVSSKTLAGGEAMANDGVTERLPEEGVRPELADGAGVLSSPTTGEGEDEEEEEVIDIKDGPQESEAALKFQAMWRGFKSRKQTSIWSAARDMLSARSEHSTPSCPCPVALH